MSDVEDTVQHRRCQGLHPLANVTIPLPERQVESQDHRAPLVTFSDDLEEQRLLQTGPADNLFHPMISSFGAMTPRLSIVL